MSASTNANTLIRDVITVRSRYVRAVNIERDLKDESALEGFLMTDAVRDALGRLCIGLQGISSQRAWRLTGAYGSGKSAFGLFLASLFTSPIGRRSMAGRILEDGAPDLFPKAKKLPRYEVLVLTGAHADPSVAIGRALCRLVSSRRGSASQRQLLLRLEKFLANRSERRAAPHDVLALLVEACGYLASGVNAVEGLLLIVDEMGRWLEFATSPDTDVDPSFFQSLAEICGGSVRGAPLAIIGILHQRFEDYAGGRRDKRAGLEWSKVAERFEDISFSQSLQSTSKLVERAIESKPGALKKAGVVRSAAALYAHAISKGMVRASCIDFGEKGAEGLYPFHPLALTAAMALFRRFGQNERSMFSFLLSSEPFAFQDFNSRHLLAADQWFRVHNLCDWIVAQNALRNIDDERRKRWALLQDVLRAAPVYDEVEVKCLKVIGLLNLLEPQPGIAVTGETVAFAIADLSDPSRIADALTKLTRKGLIYVRPATKELCLWPQSSVDVTAEFTEARKKLPPLARLGSLVAQLPAARPVVAHRHYIETGTLRTAQVTLVEDVIESRRRTSDVARGDGWIFVLPCYPDQHYPTLVKEVAAVSAEAPGTVFLALRRISEADLEIADELLVWTQVERTCEGLRVDSFARNEVRQAIHRLSGLLVQRLADLRIPNHSGEETSWWNRGKALTVTDGRSLNRCMSEAFEELYSKAPAVRNELINRTAISTAAAAARQRLIERMFSHGALEDLGIEQTPPEKAIYLTVLKDSGLHVERDGVWTFQSPAPGNPWFPAWTELRELLDREGLVSVQKVLNHFSGAPFGMRESISLLMTAAFLIVHREQIILKERGTYLTQVDGSHIARLIKRADSFELHMIGVTTGVATALAVYRDELARHLGLQSFESTVAEITKNLFHWYLGLSDFTLSSGELEASHRLALALLGKAGDPVELLTVALPGALGASALNVGRDGASDRLNLTLFKANFAAFLKGVSDHLPAMRGRLLKAMAEEMGIRDVATVRAQVVSLAGQADEELVDYALKSFIQRSCDGGRSDAQWLDSLASLIGGRSLETWRDDTLLRFRAEFRRIYALLTRVVVLAKLTRARPGPDHAVVAMHLVDQKGKERFVALPADAQGAMPVEHIDELRAVLDRFPVPAYVLAHFLLEYSTTLPEIPEAIE